MIASVSLPTLMTVASTVLFFAVERIWPGRPLPHSAGWYGRALLLNFAQLGITLSFARVWGALFADVSLLGIARWNAPVLEGFVGWFVGTFVFYWWHRLRHAPGFWLIFHQVHHSPSRIEVLTSFYKHPIEILVNSALTAVILFPLLGCSLLATFWYNFFAATGEYFYHANFKSPRWLRYLVQTPELHSIHHQIDVHKYNFSDIPIWDRLFGTYKDTTDFVPQCGFPAGNEARLMDMLMFKDVYGEELP